MALDAAGLLVPLASALLAWTLQAWTLLVWVLLAWVLLVRRRPAGMVSAAPPQVRAWRKPVR